MPVGAPGIFDVSLEGRQRNCGQYSHDRYRDHELYECEAAIFLLRPRMHGTVPEVVSSHRRPWASREATAQQRPSPESDR